MQGEIERLARLIEGGLTSKRARPELRLVESVPLPRRTLGPVTRRAYLQCIRTWAHFLNLHMLVDLACAGRSGPWALDDDELATLYERMLDARERGFYGHEPDEEGFFKTKRG